MVKRILSATGAGLLLLMLAGCKLPKEAEVGPSPAVVAAVQQGADLPPPPPAGAAHPAIETAQLPLPGASVDVAGAPRTAHVIRGTGVFQNGSRRTRGKGAPGEGPRDITLNFDKADIREVLRTIFTDILNANYLIDPAIQGSVTHRRVRPR